MKATNRRRIIAGLGLSAGAHLLGSITRSLLPEALGAELPARKRFILFTSGNGLLEKFFSSDARSETDWDLNPVLAPVAPWKKEMVVASKFYDFHDLALHGNQFATLSCVESTNPKTEEKRGPPGGISIDRLLAREIGKVDAFSSTAVGCVQEGAYAGVAANTVLCASADGPDKPFPAFYSPLKAFEAWFGAGGVMPANNTNQEKILAQNKSLLDYLRADISRLNGRLAAPEKRKLEQYLESLRVVERQLGEQAKSSGACNALAKPSVDPKNGSNYDGLDPAVLAAHIEVTFAAQLCGLTHISHITIEGMEGPHIRYSWLGDPKNHHDDHHDGNTPILAKIATWQFSQIAKMLERLSAQTVGNGTMLDQSLVAYINTCGGTHHYGHGTHPFISFGKAGGAVKGGRYLAYKDTPLSGVHIAIANAMGLPIKDFGDPKYSKGPIKGYLS